MFVRAGHQVALYLLTPDSDRVSDLPPEVTVYQGGKRRAFDLRELLRMRRVMLQWRPDVIKSFLFDANFYARLAAIGTGVPVINGERNDGYKLNRAQKIAHYPTRFLADAVVANTFSGRLFAQKLFGFSERKIHVVWNGIDLDKVARAVPSAQERQVLRQELAKGGGKLLVVVGTIRRSKDHLLALKVCKALLSRDSAWRFIFVGDVLAGNVLYRSRAADEEAAYKHQVFHYVKEAGLEKHAFFLGKRNDPIRLIAAADVLLCTSVHEGFPNVVLEAMAAGTPVVSTAYSDILRILPQPWQVSPERDPHQLAERVERAFRESDFLAAAQRTFVEQEATVEISAQRMLAVFDHYVLQKEREREK